jgi:hypothetical protein
MFSFILSRKLCAPALSSAWQVIVTLKHEWPVLDMSFSPVDDTMLVSGCALGWQLRLGLKLHSTLHLSQCRLLLLLRSKKQWPFGRPLQPELSQCSESASQYVHWSTCRPPLAPPIPSSTSWMGRQAAAAQFLWPQR